MQNWDFQKSHPFAQSKWTLKSQSELLQLTWPMGESSNSLSWKGCTRIIKVMLLTWGQPQEFYNLPVWEEEKPFFCPGERPTRHWCHYYQFFPKTLAQLSVPPVPLDFRTWVSIVSNPHNHNLTPIAAFQRKSFGSHKPVRNAITLRQQRRWEKLIIKAA